MAVQERVKLISIFGLIYFVCCLLFSTQCYSKKLDYYDYPETISSPDGFGNLVIPPHKLKEMRMVAYTKKFAKRFSLPLLAPEMEPSGGLEAIELAVEKSNRWSYLYSCCLYLYVDSSLPIIFPELGEMGDKWMVQGANHFFATPLKQWRKWSLSDRRYSSRVTNSYNMKAFLATMDYVHNKKGAINSMNHIEFRKNLLPQLTYIKLAVTMTLTLKNQRNNLGVWLPLRTSVVETRTPSAQNDRFVKFQLPQPIYENLRDWALQVGTLNGKLIKLKK